MVADGRCERKKTRGVFVQTLSREEGRIKRERETNGGNTALSNIPSMLPMLLPNMFPCSQRSLSVHLFTFLSFYLPSFPLTFPSLLWVHSLQNSLPCFPFPTCRFLVPFAQCHRDIAITASFSLSPLVGRKNISWCRKYTIPWYKDIIYIMVGGRRGGERERGSIECIAWCVCSLSFLL